MSYILSFIGYSNSGKTSLIKEVVKQLSKKNIRVGVIKHHHQPLKLPPDKDTTFFSRSGAKKVALVSTNGYQLTILNEKELSKELSIEVVLSEFKDMDLVIIEGYKKQGFLKIKVIGFCDSQLDIPENNLVAIVGDKNIEANVPVFQHNDITSIVEFIETLYFKDNIKKK